MAEAAMSNAGQSILRVYELQNGTALAFSEAQGGGERDEKECTQIH